MKTKRMLALLLAALMIVGLFAGCSKDETKDPGKTDPGNSLIDQTKPAATTAKYAYKADYLTFIHFKVKVVYGNYAAELHRNVGNAQYIPLSHFNAPPFRALCWF